MKLADRIRIEKVETLADDWAVLKKTTLAFQRSDGAWQTLTRETYDRGNGATLLLINRERGTVLLTRQFRYPAFVNGATDLLIEACAGLLDTRDAEAAIREEVEEELGVRVTAVTKIFESYMSPGSVTEKLHFFVAEYTPGDRISGGGGVAHEGEDIEVVEVPFAQALAMIERGEIVDGKTIMLLLYAQWKQLAAPRR
ncbi:MAG TPA: NUDIX domain-containing protein [Kofleriaceae bacterium]|jgi:nudix-type nucleoside diphosphatase (YffH/AdpP family)|nr:NUDIX domain-containing protein [Kofleriaceae bacterium]